MTAAAVTSLTLIVLLLPGVAEAASPKPPWPKGAPITQANVKYALGHAPKKLLCSLALSKPMKVVVNDGTGSVDLTYKTTDSDVCHGSNGEVDQLWIGSATTYGAERAMFQNPRVQQVSVTVLGDWVDQYGKVTSEPSTVSVLGRATVDSRIGWNGLADRVEADNKIMFCASDQRYIHPAIIAKLGDLGCLVGL